MALELTLSCDLDKKENGPTLIHSTGVPNYKIPQDVIHILQDSLTNELLSDHEDGVLCQDSPQRILDILQQNGFTLQNESTDDQKAIWTVVKGGSDGGDNQQPVPPPHEADAEGEDQGGEDKGENKDEEEGGGGGGEEQEAEE